MLLSQLRPQSPKKIDRTIHSLVDYLGLNVNDAVHLKFSRPTAFVPEPDYCHFNVWLQTRHSEGKPLSGWIFAQDKQQCFAEAIFHSVWESPDGRLIDVTPRKDQEKRILFVPDPTRSITLTSYKGRPALHTFDNVRVHHNSLITQLTEITLVVEGDFLERQGLWPW